jgi:hypothetical protein
MEEDRMRMKIESTDQLTFLDGVKVRVWKGKTEGDVDCIVFVRRLAVAFGKDASRFDAEIQEELPPATVVDLRKVL